ALRSVGDVLEAAADVLIADGHVELAVRSEVDNAGVVVTAPAVQREVRDAWRKLDDVRVEGEGLAVPEEAVDAVAEVGHCFEVFRGFAEEAVRDGAFAAPGPVDVDPVVGFEVRVEGEAEDAALIRVVGGELQDGLLLHLATC